ncbi:hypothetical protein [Zavarzinella formosa]|uniref:hypothetical protein n=1 Tax=Zavarzinella formosa TaxID=360055 RepID=UPI0003021C54|nr:hypothetical protein [Zavarzinella formosa]
MWTSVALLATALSLTPGQAPETLTLGNPRATYGELGPARTEMKLLPGDIFFLAFDIEGIKVTNTGRVRYGMVMEVIDSGGKSIFKQQPVERDDFLPLGGTKLPARAFVSIGIDQPAGIYTCKVTVSDLANKEKPVVKSLEQKFEVAPRSFGMVQVYTAADIEGKVPASLYGVAGQFVFVHFALIDFQRDPKTKQPDITVEMTVYDKDSKPTLEKSTVKQIPDKDDGNVDEKLVGVPMRFLVPMNREGGFVIRLTATDNISKKTTKVDLPLRVFPAGN